VTLSRCATLNRALDFTSALLGVIADTHNVISLQVIKLLLESLALLA
jgi:hypothetical protein